MTTNHHDQRIAGCKGAGGHKPLIATRANMTITGGVLMDALATADDESG